MFQSCTSVFGNRNAEYGIFSSANQPDSLILVLLLQTKFNKSLKSPLKILASSWTPLLVIPKKNPFCRSLYVSMKIAKRSKFGLKSSRTDSTFDIESGWSKHFIPKYNAS